MGLGDFFIVVMLAFIAWNLKAGFQGIIRELQRIGDKM